MALESEMFFCSSTALPVSRSVAKAANGIGSLARSLIMEAGSFVFARKRSSSCVVTMP